MAADATFRDIVLSKLTPLPGISCRSMFGGYGIFSEGRMFGLISGSALFFKVDGSNVAVYEEAGSERCGPMPYYRVPAPILEDDARLIDWARVSLVVAQAAKKKG